ncbi:cytochrome P450 [Thermomonospora umbrina]|uniref:cytochrome P450 n=1 Tax=Thermomonospora umbrina TaxID=111806 RepID=UPI001476D3BB|nr:cytochrome P450 [Thermomonospora umbrina]
MQWFDPPGYPSFWAVTRHADVKAVSADPALFSSRTRVTLAPLHARPVEESFAGVTGRASRTLLSTDPPEHRDYRNLALPYFRPKVLRALEERVREISRELLDQAPERLDFITDVAAWHPLRMISEIIGLSREHEGLVLRLTNEFVGIADTEFARDSRAEFAGYLRRLIADRRAAPTDDLVGVLANARLNGEPLSDLDTLLYLLIIVIAGHDTTRSALGGGLLALLRHPEQLALLRERPELCGAAADEIVRWTSPVVHFVRKATADCELGGREIRAGDRLALFYPSANRDEEVFEDPFDFRVDRDPNPHLGWGFGEHYCLGARLAHMEIRVMLEELIPRLRSVDLAGEPSWMGSGIICGLKHLPIRWTLDR